MVPKGKTPININFEWPVDKQLAPVDSATIDGTTWLTATLLLTRSITPKAITMF